MSRLFEKMDNVEVAAVLMRALTSRVAQNQASDPALLASTCVVESLRVGSRDNMSAIVVQLRDGGARVKYAALDMLTF